MRNERTDRFRHIKCEINTGMKFLLWKEDHWFSENGNFIKHDKLEHFLAAFVVVFAGSFFFISLGVVLVAVVAGIAWEVKDGILPYDSAGNIEGFSWKDLIADIWGIAGGHIVFMNLKYWAG